MASISGTGLITAADLYQSNALPGAELEIGQLLLGKLGKGFRYILAGASNLVVGNLLQESANDTTYANMVVGTAGAVGDTFVQVTNGTATITALQFKGGSLSVYTAGTVAVADEYTITDVTGTLTTGGALNVYVDRTLRSVFSTSATVNMKRSPWSGVIQFPTTQTGIPVGIAIFPTTAAQYGFVQTKGVGSVLSDGSTFAVGSDLSSKSGTAGAVTVGTAGTTFVRIGAARQVAAAAKGISAMIQID